MIYFIHRKSRQDVDLEKVSRGFKFYVKQLALKVQISF
ncbi:unnamed protein product [Paramecium sonneborni]|uniref:Uncharacterized protein n=1 Tax=Paramecium sonneborni TaxID=65129 RepID=A0A8S1REH2_9CILI|nr:unnamed protein product [Paramecium sonneborni]